jgi:hypothetical protein
LPRRWIAFKAIWKSCTGRKARLEAESTAVAIKRIAGAARFVECLKTGYPPLANEIERRERAAILKGIHNVAAFHDADGLLHGRSAVSRGTTAIHRQISDGSVCSGSGKK